MLDFWLTGSDVGTHDVDAIQPIENGEQAIEDTFNRPAQNLRNRTEVINKAFGNLEMIARSDRGLQVFCDKSSYITSYSVGTNVYFTFDNGYGGSRDLVIAPMVSTFDALGGSPILAKYTYNDGLGSPGVFTITAQASLKAADGSNNIFFEVIDSGSSVGASPTVAVTGNTTTAIMDPNKGPVLIQVDIETGVTTIQNVVDRLNLNPDFSGICVAAVTSNGGNAMATVTHRRIWDGDSGSMGGIDNESIWLGTADFVGFFGVGGSTRTMAEGDVLVLDFENAFDRRNADSSTTGSSLLRIVSDDSRNAANGYVIPIAKVFDQSLYFLNGQNYGASAAGERGLVMVDNTLRDDLADQDTSSGTCGAELVGVDVRTASTSTDYPNTAEVSQGTLYDQLGEVIEYIGMRPFVVLGNGSQADYNTILSALTALEYGGTMFIRPQAAGGSVYNSWGMPISYSGNFRSSVRIVGESKGDNISGSTGTRLYTNIILDGDLHGDILFENIHFEIASGKTLWLELDPINTDSRVIFKNCKFTIENGVIPAVTTHLSTEFHDCEFYGKDYTASTAIKLDNSASVTSQETRGIRICNCKFYRFHKIIEETATSSLNQVVFENNLISSCGYAPAAPTHQPIIYSLSNATDWVINNNYWEDTGVVAENSGLFMFVKGKAVVTNNKLLRENSFNTIGYDAVSIAGESQMFVSNNIIHTGVIQAVSFEEGTCEGNYVLCTSAGAIFGILKTISGVIANNTVNITGGSGSTLAILGGNDSIIKSNIVNLVAEMRGILSIGDRSIVDGNRVKFSSFLTSNLGIHCTGDNTTCSNNIVIESSDGIEYNGSSGGTITGNKVIFSTSSISAAGIVVNCNDSVVVGNHIIVYGTTPIGMSVAGNNVCVSGNQVVDPLGGGGTSITISGTDVGVGNAGSSSLGAAEVTANNWVFTAAT